MVRSFLPQRTCSAILTLVMPETVSSPRKPTFKFTAMAESRGRQIGTTAPPASKKDWSGLEHYELCRLLPTTHLTQRTS
ncbi:hypothetical protein B0T16DRAFT_419838 [Cercophora newfieldiana]|uniref:Uncharacterized protein n=1 Tax=Cercophora newfieldiana TaxID=92897 RepID=A0AA39XXL3_9PEZI|nr:hypothetical protein B0T16DRAFT_419838 [Cercophora newfieldiana]